MSAIRVVAPVSELAIAQCRIRAPAVAGCIECGPAVVVQICLGHAPAARGRIVLPRWTGRVGHAVALVVVHSAGLACHADDADDAGRLQRRAVVEEVRVTIGFLLALEVTIFDRQLQALAAVDSLRTWLGVGVEVCGAGVPVFDFA